MPFTRLLAFAVLLVAASTSLAVPSERVLNSYPFFASHERALLIRGNYRQVAPGMTAHEAAKFLGEPDEVRTLYEAGHKNSMAIGYTQWYVVRRLVASGSAEEKNESLVRVSFDLNDRVTRVDAWGL